MVESGYLGYQNVTVTNYCCSGMVIAELVNKTLSHPRTSHTPNGPQVSPMAEGNIQAVRPRLQRGDTMMTARRVAAAKYDLELIKRDVCKWLSEILQSQSDISPETFIEKLHTGVILCQLVEEKAKALEEAEGEDPP